VVWQGFKVIFGKKKKKMSADFVLRSDGYTLWLLKAAFVEARSNFGKQKSPHFLSGTFVMLWEFFFGFTCFGWAENVCFRKT
jgi:hypothetical protein